MKSMIDLWRELANELASWCHTSTALDIKKLESRTEAEGISFLTITLPSFGKDFERCLEVGLLDSNSFAGFKRKDGLPLFLGGFLCQIFDPSSGVLLAEPNVDCIFAIRQLTLLFGKILLPCSDNRVRDAYLGYVKCEEELREWESHGSFEDITKINFERVALLLFADVFSRLDKLVYDGELYPRHGPGATADRVSGNRKFSITKWSLRLEELFPFGDFALPNWRYYYRYDHVEILEPGNEIPVRVIHVPKTLRTPRIIAIEPAHVQYMQQAILKPMVENLESGTILGNTRKNIASHFLGFSDQGPNRDLAAQGSKEGDLATLDLSEASDRVHILHVEALFKRFPSLWEGVSATRSTKAEIPSIGVDIYSLRKFASMGSALCFPVEAMVFLVAIFLGIEQKLGHHLTRKDLLSYVGKVRVYGDDLIVPVDCVNSVIESLARLGFKVNTHKSFWNGKFRESCGGDFYDGVDVTPVRFRRVFPRDRRDVSEMISLVAFRNLLYERGLWKTAAWLDRRICGLIPYYPIAEPTTSGLCRRSFLPYQAEKIDERTHAPRIRAYVPVPRFSAISADDVGALLKCLMSTGSDPILPLPNGKEIKGPAFIDPKHLERSGRPIAVDIKLKWILPY